MAKQRPKRTGAAHVRDLLAASPAVAQCLDLQRREDRLLAAVRDLLAPAARPHCIQANNVDGNLTLTVDAAAWATRLRYQAPELAQALAGAGVTAVKIRACPRERRGLHQTAEHLTRLTPVVIDHLLEAAEHTVDAGIAELYRRLASRHRVPSPGDQV